jgi:hypothetical protein
MIRCGWVRCAYTAIERAEGHDRKQDGGPKSHWPTSQGDFSFFALCNFAHSHFAEITTIAQKPTTTIVSGAFS